jgi:hypothetical protein
MRIASDDHLARPGVPFLDHDLVSDPTSRREKVYVVGLGKLFDLGVFGEVGSRLVLDVVVERKDGLTRVEDLGALEGGKSERGAFGQ